MSPTASRLDIVALGEPMVEFNQARAESPELYLRGFGGDTSNMAIAAARSGARVAYVTRVGDDAFGRALAALWTEEGIDLSGVAIDTEAATGVYFVAHGPQGHEFTYLRAGSAASRMRPQWLPHELISGSRLLHVSGISQAISATACDTVFAAIALARTAGALVTYDPNLRLKLWPLARARGTILATVAQCSWCLPSEDDARALFAELPADTAADQLVDALHRAGAPGVVLKMGPAGCIVSDGARRTRVSGHSVATVDATGAGDCFDGNFAARLLAGDDPVSAARYANAAAALATTGFGAVAPLPTASTVQSYLKRTTTA